ncbi:hypothetical protein BpHYR1_001262 [Brachionus plicatilis]|uniref:Uncharacterized protein n=1 Tax=Brachionus plicatilis TaxID=10195 RepID=A0A3M7RD37_BRAPC|nr:hypothetical protein BpHYR1_001262 [Brachionus plicatilis]
MNRNPFNQDIVNFLSHIKLIICECIFLENSNSFAPLKILTCGSLSPPHEIYKYVSDNVTKDFILYISFIKEIESNKPCHTSIDHIETYNLMSNVTIKNQKLSFMDLLKPLSLLNLHIEMQNMTFQFS